MKQATLYDLLQAESKSLYSNWCDTLRLLRQVTEPSAKKMYLQDLTELHSRAYGLRATNQLSGMNLSMMNLVLSRTVEQWTVLNKNGHSSIVRS
jgi:hypothetical protein